jgi:hypothetical protein
MAKFRAAWEPGEGERQSGHFSSEVGRGIVQKMMGRGGIDL